MEARRDRADAHAGPFADCADGAERRRALAGQFEAHRERLRFLLQLRLNPRLRGRVDPSDLIQDAYLQAEHKLDAYLADPRMPFYLWLRRMAIHTLHEAHRRHLGAQIRDARRELLRGRGEPEATSGSMAHLFVARDRSPSEAAVQAEREATVQRVLEQLSAADREIIALRVFERLATAEVAGVLGIKADAVRQRFARALTRFKAAYGRPLDVEDV